MKQKKVEKVIPDFLNNAGNLHVDCWKVHDNDLVVKNGKLVDIKFDKVFKADDLKDFNSFVIKKKGYIDKLDIICRYINYFLEFYDTDKELIMGYYKLKYIMDNKDKRISFISFRKMMYSILFTDSIVEKIKQFVDDNYTLCIDEDPESKRYSDQTKFSDQHAKILLRASMGIKIMVPIALHYIHIEKLSSPTKLYELFEKTLEIFTDPGINMYNKIWIWLKIKTMSDYKSNTLLWEQRSVYGADPSITMTKLKRRNYIVDTLFKYNFIENVIKLNNVVVGYQLKFANKTKYKHNLVEVLPENGAEGVLTRIDKMMMNSAKIDESIIVISERNRETIIGKLKYKMRNVISDDEIEYYYKNTRIGDVQRSLVNYAFASMFNGFTDLDTLTRREYITLMVILKKMLLMKGRYYLAQIVSSINDGKTSNRLKQNSAFLSKLSKTDLFIDLMDNKFKNLKTEDLNTNRIILLLSSMLNSKFVYVDYDNQEINGELIEIDNEQLGEEFLRFVQEI